MYSKTCPYRNVLGTKSYSGLDRFRFGRVFVFGEDKTTIISAIDMRVIIQDVSSVVLQMIGGFIQKKSYKKTHIFLKMFYYIKIISI